MAKLISKSSFDALPGELMELILEHLLLTRKTITITLEHRAIPEYPEDSIIGSEKDETFLAQFLRHSEQVEETAWSKIHYNIQPSIIRVSRRLYEIGENILYAKNDWIKVLLKAPCTGFFLESGHEGLIQCESSNALQRIDKSLLLTCKIYPATYGDPYQPSEEQVMHTFLGNSKEAWTFLMANLRGCTENKIFIATANRRRYKRIEQLNINLEIASQRPQETMHQKSHESLINWITEKVRRLQGFNHVKLQGVLGVSNTGQFESFINNRTYSRQAKLDLTTNFTAMRRRVEELTKDLKIHEDPRPAVYKLYLLRCELNHLFSLWHYWYTDHGREVPPRVLEPDHFWERRAIDLFLEESLGSQWTEFVNENRAIDIGILRAYLSIRDPDMVTMAILRFDFIPVGRWMGTACAIFLFRAFATIQQGRNILAARFIRIAISFIVSRPRDVEPRLIISNIFDLLPYVQADLRNPCHHTLRVLTQLLRCWENDCRIVQNLKRKHGDDFRDSNLRD
ncbi:hypothetical protein MMC25_002662 [Agyrium rufum]|nr:hypothetical protein [Agyrium rufum]